jgi:hypothetical protein
MTSKLPSYPALESDATLPADIRAIANLRHRVVAWTALDPSREAEVSGYMCGSIYGAYGILFCPCCWPILIVSLPCTLSDVASTTNMLHSQYWILTETELKVVVTRHDTSCIPGCCELGDNVKTIPLENITDCGVSSRATGLVDQCAGTLPEIYVDTASVTGGMATHEATGIALAGYERFLIKGILSRVTLSRQLVLRVTGWRHLLLRRIQSWCAVPSGQLRIASKKSPISTIVKLLPRMSLTRSDKKSLTRFDTRNSLTRFDTEVPNLIQEKLNNSHLRYSLV